MPHFWKLSGIQPDVVLVLLLMLMYDRFFGRIGGRASHPMISRSPILRHLLAILEDTQVFPFFARDDLMRMLMYHGQVLRVVRAICGPTTYVNRNMHGSIMRIILNRILRCIPSNFEASMENILAYPIRRESQLLVSLETFHSRNVRVLNIWVFLSLIKGVLPEPQAILDISRSDLNESQQEHYGKIFLVTLFRKLFIERNKVFLLFCKIFHQKEKFVEEERLLGNLCLQFKEEFNRARGSRDFQLFMQYFESISTSFPGTRYPMDSEITWCFKIMNIFYRMMYYTFDDYWKFVDMVFRNESVDGVLSLLEKGCEPFFCKHVNQPFEVTLEYPAQYPAQSEGTPQQMVLFQTLRLAHLIDIPRDLLRELNERKNSYLNNDPLRVRNTWSRLLFLLCTFIQLVQSKHPHICFLLDSFIFMRTSQASRLDQLAMLIDIGNMQVEGLLMFDELLHHFCSFSNPIAGFSDMTERSFLGLFDLMICILSDNHFFADFSQFLSRSGGHTSSSIDEFIVNLQQKFPQFVTQILPFQCTTCFQCGDLLSPDRDEYMCDNCKRRDAMYSPSNDSSSYDDDDYDSDTS